jgi:HPt (histidine-containing phosphotransfer) domain-containing protein
MLAHDADLGALVEMFAEEVPERVRELRELRAAGDWAGVGLAAHQLKGAAGSYGFHELTPYAAQLDAAIRQKQATNRAMELLEALLDACGRIRAG